MLKNFLKIAYRNLFKYKYYAIINISGFAIGLTAFVISSLYALDELSYDSFHEKSDRIFRIVNVYEKDSTLNKYSTNPFPLAKALIKEHPDLIEQVVRIFNFQNRYHLVEYHHKHSYEENFFYADANILKVFDFEFIKGKRDSALLLPNTVIISEKIKKEYFGEFNPIGKEIIIDEGFPMIVTGVFKDFPEQSHVHFDILTPFSSLYSIFKEPETWLWSPCWTYVLLKEEIKPGNLECQFPDFVRKHFDKAVKDYSWMYLQPITTIHLDSNLESELEPNTKLLYIYILFAISLFLIFVSWLNFVNLSVVGSITRIREVSIRKILGSSRRIIISQFLVEAILLSTLAFLLSLFLLEIIIPVFNISTGQKLQIRRLLENGIFLKVLMLTIVAGTFTGLYTGVYASNFPTSNIGGYKHRLASRKWFSGKILILIQYSISLVLLISVFANFKQLVYLKNTNLGFEEKNVLVIPIVNSPIAENYENFKSTLLKNSHIASISTMNYIVGEERSYRKYFFEKEGWKKSEFFPELIVRHDFIKALGIEVVAGSGFRKGSSENVKSAANELMINEKLAKLMGFKTNNAAIRKKLESFKGEERIVDVIKDFNTRSLHSPVSPLVIRLSESNDDAIEDSKYMVIKFSKRISKKTLKEISKLWYSYTSTRPLEFKLLDSILDKQYKNEDLLNFFLWVYSLLIIIISSMGVWVVTSLLSIQRTKEIGIRKAIGASTWQILRLFMKDFANIIIVANIIAWPVAWILLKFWFKNFAHHVNIEWQVFLYASLSILLLTLAIVAKHALKVANSNTVNALRDE